MNIELFNYNLPLERIAQAPVRPRERAKMLYYDKDRDVIRDHRVGDVPLLLQAGDLLVFNVSRVRAARVYGTRNGFGKLTTGMEHASHEAEFLILKPLNENGLFECLIRGKKIEIGEKIMINSHSGAPLKSTIMSNVPGHGQHDNQIMIEVVNHQSGETGLFTIQVKGMNSAEFLVVCEQIGELPLPPYINNPQLLGHEQELYQPILARELGSVAAPTAGLHFSQKLLDELTMKGIKTAEVILHVGLGTFLPVKVQDTDDHIMHAEQFEISPELVQKIKQTKVNGGRVIAVGTTVARALESAVIGDNVDLYHGETSLFIQPGFRFEVIDGLLTNFHLPKSTLLMMVSAFIGREKLFELYDHALASNYRFLSFGDCMLIL